jgi:hypothetical protein
MDGGQTWHPAQGGLPPDAPREIATSPNYAEDATLFLSTHGWVWRSHDGGANWHRLPGYCRKDDHHPAVFNEGEWAWQYQADSFALAVTLSDEVDATHELEFYGENIVWYALKDAGSGMAEVILDGQLAATVDLFAQTTLSKQPVFVKVFGEPDWHTIRIRVTGTKHPDSTDIFVKSDGFEYAY